jgi:pantoate--beta-alanine ligase
MKVFSDKLNLRLYLKSLFLHNKTVGFVPTMGALHDGHLSLIERSKSQNDFTVCSIFVNPTQFNDDKDFQTYPQPLLRDELALEKIGCDVLFLPNVSDIYPAGVENLQVKMSFGSLAERLEGQFRPGHFSGVGLVVCKLFNIVRPNKAYFGQKDYQQFLIIEKMVQELDFDVELEMVETRRDPEGLALSSRNEKLNPAEKLLAPYLYKALVLAKQNWLNTRNYKTSVESAMIFLKSVPEIEPQYLEIVNRSTLNPVADGYTESVVICVAAKIGDIRLIDNLLVE